MPTLEIRMRPMMYLALVEMFRLRRGDCRSVDDFALELLEAEAADFRSKKRPARAPIVTAESEPASSPLHPCMPHRRTFAVHAQRILHLSISEGLSVQKIAERVGCGGTTVRRILANFERAQHVEVPTRP